MKNKCVKSIGAVVLTVLMGWGMTGCTSDGPYVLSKTDISVAQPEGGFVVSQDQLLRIDVQSLSDENIAYEWFLNGESISHEKNLSFMCTRGGGHALKLKVTQGTISYEYDFSLTVTFTPMPDLPEGSSPYITQVFDFCPAPGQFTNEMPQYEEGDTQETMNKKVLEAIGHNNNGMISLGAYGGYVVVGFDHTIQNVEGEKDFKVLGNAFYANSNPRPDAPLGGSCEPGIVLVAYDGNRNGKPDEDEWYELAGSEYHKESTIKGYEITYRRNAPDHQAVPDEEVSWNVDTKNCAWTDNQEGKGYVYKNMFHQQDYFPRWIDKDELTFKGTLLPKNGVDESGEGTYWVLYAFDWGYVDNRPNNEEGSNFDIGWAVDANGQKVNLPGVDFIKIYTGVNQYCGWLGEESTEVAGVIDLHLTKK